jgi:gliding motility-associated-like protein
MITLATSCKLAAGGAFYSLIAMPHENNKDFWIISRKYIDTFLIIHFNGDGIVKTKKQTFNKPYTPFYASKGYFENWTRLSQSNSGKYFLESFHIENFLSDSLGYPGFYLFVSYVNIFDFDNSRGEITNKNILVKHFTNDIKERRNIFNAAFSPNDSVIYVLYSGINVRELQPIKQFFYNGTSFIYNTEIINNFSIDGLLMDIKLAPNGKIYLSCNQRPYVAEIPYPNKLGKSFDFYPKKIKVSKNDESVSTALPNTYFQYINLNLKHKRCGSPYNFISYYDTTVFKYFTWYFEGGDSAVGADVNYHFPKTGRYFVKLKGISENGYCQWYSDSITYIKPPQANFSFDSKQGCQWIGFNFYDSSTTDTIHPTKGQSWIWDFGDGTFDTAQNPTHVFTETGFYNVKLVYSNGFCEDSIIKTQSIEIIAAPKPGFAVNESQYCTPFDLKITDQSVGDVQEYLYSSSNGLSSIQPNPVFHFNQPGAYKILQTLTGPTGCITKDSTTIHLTKGFDSLETINILTATVNPQEFIEVNWEKHPTANNYQVYRNGKELTQIVGNTFNDSGVDVHNSVYSYKVAGLDSCGSFSQNSLPVKNILLNGESQGNEFCIVHWTAFEQWQSGVESYVVEKKDSTGNFVPISQTNSQTHQDNNFVSSVYENQSCYRIRATENNGNNQESTSNILCLPYKTIIFLPNAFSPNGDGLNDVFNPIGVSIENFHIEIYNQWGQQVFASNNILNGWDGTFKSSPSPQGTYYYQLSATGTEGEKYSEKGTVLLMR